MKQHARALWLTGLSGAGKSTLAVNLERRLFDNGFICQVLDGDNIRSGINRNLGFSEADRHENIRRIAEVAKLYLQSGIITICAFVSPTRDLRDLAREIIGADDFLEIYVSTPLEVCESRDVKGLYKKARAGEIPDFTGISAPYEAPETPFLEIPTHQLSMEHSLELMYQRLYPIIQHS